MRRWMVVPLVVALSTPALAQSQSASPCGQLVECQIRVLYLKEAREFAEAQLAIVQALISKLTSEGQAKDQEIKRLQDKYEPKSPPPAEKGGKPNVPLP